MYKPKPLDMLYKFMSLYHPSTFICKQTYEQYGLYDIDLKCCMDRELLLRILSGGGRFLYIDEQLVKVSAGGMSEKNYLTHTIPEGKEISIKYGKNRVVASIEATVRTTKFLIRNIMIKCGLHQLYHSLRRRY